MAIAVPNRGLSLRTSPRSQEVSSGDPGARRVSEVFGVASRGSRAHPPAAAAHGCATFRPCPTRPGRIGGRTVGSAARAVRSST